MLETVLSEAACGPFPALAFRLLDLLLRFPLHVPLPLHPSMSISLAMTLPSQPELPPLPLIGLRKLKEAVAVRNSLLKGVSQQISTLLETCESLGDSHESIRRKPYFYSVRAIRANRLKPAIYNF